MPRKQYRWFIPTVLIFLALFLLFLCNDSHFEPLNTELTIDEVTSDASTVPIIGQASLAYTEERAGRTTRVSLLRMLPRYKCQGSNCQIVSMHNDVIVESNCILDHLKVFGHSGPRTMISYDYDMLANQVALSTTTDVDIWMQSDLRNLHNRISPQQVIAIIQDTVLDYYQDQIYWIYMDITGGEWRIYLDSSSLVAKDRAEFVFTVNRWEKVKIVTGPQNE